MNVFLDNWNGVLDMTEDKLRETGRLTDSPHLADIFLLWQDVRGPQRQLARIVKYQLKKPLVVMQHGRGAVRDYGPPNNFELLADKILVWGETDKSRLLRYGISQDRILVVGCPIFQRLRPKDAERKGKNVLFVPVISTKEEPENILVYAALKRWESEQLIKTVVKRFNDLKRAWAWQHDDIREVTLPDNTKEQRLWKRSIMPKLPRWLTYETGLVNAKLSGVHDQFQYQCPQLTTHQNSPNLIDDLVGLLSNIDVMVCLEEGTMQLLAAKMGIPVIVVDIFRYENYGGCKDYDVVEKIRTNACYLTKDLSKLSRMLDHALKYPNELSKCQKSVCELEGGVEHADIIEILEAIIKQRTELIAA